MYQVSSSFKSAVQYIEQRDYDDWYILSAKYGLLSKQEEIEPYDLTLNKMKVIERKEWAKLVLKQIAHIQGDLTEIDFYAGIRYRQDLIPVNKRALCVMYLLKEKE